MKTTLLLSIACLFSLAAIAQQQYLLQPDPSGTGGSIEINESALLQKISGQKVKLNRVEKGIDGYRIEIYQGSDRKIAQELLDKFKEEHANVPADLVFESPYVKVKVGTFRSKLEAYKLYTTLKEEEYEVVKIVFVKGMQFPPIHCNDYQLNGGKKKNKGDAKVEEVDDF